MQEFASFFNIANQKCDCFFNIFLCLISSLTDIVICCNEEFASKELIDLWRFWFFNSFFTFCQLLEFFEENGRFGDLWIVSFGFELWMSCVWQSKSSEGSELVRGRQVIVLDKEKVTSSKRTEYPSKWTWIVVLMAYLLMLLILPTFHLC